MPRQDLIQVRRDSAADWTSANPTLAAGEFGFEEDTNKLKCGDGSTAWNSLDYVSGSIPPATDAGSVLDLSNPMGTYYNMSSADTNTTYTYTGAVLGGVAFKLINCESQPSVTSATRIYRGSYFEENVDMYLVVQYNGNRVEYWYERISADLRIYVGLPYGQIIAQSSDPLNDYYASPCILKTTTGRYVVSHDIFGTGNENKKTKIYYVDDISSNIWTQSATLDDFIWGTLFEYSGDVYILGVNNYPNGGDIVISKSTDDGLTWSAPVIVLADPGGSYDGWSTAPINPIFKDGYLVKAFTLRLGASYFDDFDQTLVFADLTDLTDSGNWSYSNVVTFNGTAFEAAGIAADAAHVKKPGNNNVYKGFLEGCLVEKANGDLINVLRLEQSPNSNNAVYLDVSWNSGTPTSSTLGSTHNFIEMNGGHIKFQILWDSTSSKHWSIVNTNRARYFGNNRIEAYLISSDDDCATWTTHEKVLGDNIDIDWETDINQYGYQYSHFIIDGNNLITVTRASNDEGADFHDTNLFTITVIKNFRTSTAQTYVDGCLIIDENSVRLEDANGISLIHDQSKYYNSPFMLTADNSSKVDWVDGEGMDFNGAEFMRVMHHQTLNPDINDGFSIFVVVENIATTTASVRFLSKASAGFDDIQTKDWLFTPGTCLGVQNSRGTYTGDLTPGNDYIFASSFDNANNYIYNYLNGANRGEPGTKTNCTWSTDHLAITPSYTAGNFGDLYIGKRINSTPLYCDSTIKAIHIIPNYMNSTAMIAYMDDLNATYSIY